MEQINTKIFEIKKIGIQQGMSDMNAEFYARVMINRFPGSHESYLKEWAIRFKDGTHFHHADKETTIAILNVMTTPWKGTAKHIDKKIIEDWIRGIIK